MEKIQLIMAVVNIAAGVVAKWTPIVLSALAGKTEITDAMIDEVMSDRQSIIAEGDALYEQIKAKRGGQ